MNTYTLCTNIFRLYIFWLYVYVWIMLIQQWDYFMLACEIDCKLTAFSGCLLCIDSFLNPVSLQCSPYLQPQFSFLPIEALRLPCFPVRTHWLLRWAGFSAENAAVAAALGCERCVGLPFALQPQASLSRIPHSITGVYIMAIKCHSRFRKQRKQNMSITTCPGLDTSKDPNDLIPGH